MSIVSKHKEKALWNESFYEYVKKGKYNDWAVTGLFYAAIHLIEGFLASKGISVGSHSERMSCIVKISELKLIFEPYRKLYDFSVNARYKFYKLSESKLENLYQNTYKPLKESLMKYL